MRCAQGRSDGFFRVRIDRQPPAAVAGDLADLEHNPGGDLDPGWQPRRRSQMPDDRARSTGGDLFSCRRSHMTGHLHSRFFPKGSVGFRVRAGFRSQGSVAGEFSGRPARGVVSPDPCAVCGQPGAALSADPSGIFGACSDGSSSGWCCWRLAVRPLARNQVIRTLPPSSNGLSSLTTAPRCISSAGR